jgi:hypothetical protein
MAFDTLKKEVMNAWTAFIWLRMRVSGRLFWTAFIWLRIRVSGKMLWNP